MRRQLKAALGVGGIVLATTVLGLTIFLYLGSEIGVYVIGVGVPVTVVVTVGLYVRSVLTRDKTGTGDFVQEKARDVAESFRDEVTIFNRLSSSYPKWDPENTRIRARQLADDFADAGVDVDLDTATFDVRSPERIQVFDRLESDIESFATERDQAFATFAKTEIERTQEGTRFVSSSILGREDQPAMTDIDTVSEDSDLEEIEQALSKVREEAESAYREAIDRIESAVEEYNGDTAEVEAHLDEARRQIDAYDWDGASQNITIAQQAAESEVGDAFTADREALVQLLTTVESSEIGSYAEDEDIRTFEEAQTRLEKLDSAVANAELDALKTEVRAAAESVVGTLENELNRHIRTIRDGDVPMGFYTAPPAVATDYVDQISDAPDLESFRSEWLTAVGELLDAIETAEKKASVVDSYAMIEERIEEGLRSHGRVRGDDIPVRDAEPFFDLYVENHPDVEYDPTTPEVSVEGGGESYEVTVTAQLETSTGEEHDLIVELSGTDIEYQETDSTFVATEVTFGSVPYGEYMVSVSTPSKVFEDEETKIMVNEPRSVEIILPELTVRERVCGDNEDEIQEQLPSVAPKLEEKFAAEEHLTPESDIPVTDEYIPCLLALWAEQESHEVRMDNGQVLVYDHDRFRSRLETITTHNLADGETMTYDDMRQKFLSVPASDDLIATTLREFETDLTVEETEVRA